MFPNSTNNDLLVYKITSSIPKGKVLTYAALAKLANVKSPRVVGRILRQNKDPEKIPCYRVVNSKGKLASNYAFGGAEAQAEKLRSEEVILRSSKVDLSQYLWVPDALTL